MITKKSSAMEAEYKFLLLIWRLVNGYYFRDDGYYFKRVDDYYFRDIGLLLKHPFGGEDTPITLVGAPSETKIYAFGFENTMSPSAPLSKLRAPSELKTSALRVENLAFGSEKFYCSLRLSCQKRESHPNVRVLHTLRKFLHIVEGLLWYVVRICTSAICSYLDILRIYKNLRLRLNKNSYCFLRFILILFINFCLCTYTLSA